MRQDDKVPFLILATRQSSTPFTALFFVRAKSLADAYTLVLKDRGELCQHPDIRLQGYVVSMGMVAPALPLKELARFYWNLACTAKGSDNFTKAWDEHGAEPDA